MNTADAPRILIVEDDRDLVKILTLHLEDLGFQVECATTEPSGLGMAVSGNYSLVILDLSLPDLDGLAICERLRSIDPGLPIIILTARTTEGDKLKGFELGADDYITKPFSIPELLARVQAVLRRSAGETVSSNGNGAEGSIRIGELTVDFEKRSVQLDKTKVALTVTEFELLAFFASRPGRAYSREELLRYVWGYEYRGYENTVNVHINRLRSKIEPDPSNPTYILTIRGVGYRFAEASELEGGA